MHTNQIEIILQYLKIETNYAIIINGKYGTGKTYFYKQYLMPAIADIELPKDAQKKYTPVHISLFGYKSLEEIQSAIFVELYPILKKKGIKLAIGLGKSILRGIAQIGQAGDIDKYIGDIDQDADTWLKYDELVICFDDLDRKSDELNIKDVFGFINSLVENQGAKVLIIANEEELLKDSNYSTQAREKVIGVSIQFKPNPAFVFNQIIAERYSATYTVFFEFLNEYANRIIPIIEINQNNFRNLIFFLEHFKTIFGPIVCLFQEDKEFAILKNEKLCALLDFTIAVTIEYKLGFLNSTNLNVVENIDNVLGIIDIRKLLESSNDIDTEAKPSYVESFRKKYFLNTKYYFFRSIFEYITGSNPFVVEELKKELENYFITKEGKIPDQEKILHDLDYSNFFKLSDKDYLSLTFEMLSYVKLGEYNLRQYPIAFQFATRFDNLLGFNIDRLKRSFKAGIKKGKKKYVYQQDLVYSMHVSSDSEFKDDLIEITQYCLEINSSLFESNSKNELTILYDLFLSDYLAFIELVTSDSHWNHYSFWSEFDITKVYKRIVKLNKADIWNIANYFRNRYQPNIFEGLYPEKEFIVNFLNHSNKASSTRTKKNLLNISLDHLSKCLSQSLSNFPS
jgi:hypothetical protein